MKHRQTARESKLTRAVRKAGGKRNQPGRHREVTR